LGAEPRAGALDRAFLSVKVTIAPQREIEDARWCGMSAWMPRRAEC
jgi:hypothetical protein